MSTETILMVLALFQLKHFIADYPLQTPYMYENKGKAIGWAKPLSDHARLHAFLTFMIITAVTNNFYLATASATFDYLTHFIIDRWKAKQKHTPADSKFWINLGLDQMLHHLVGIIIIAGIYIV